MIMLQATCDALHQTISTLPTEISTWIKYTPSSVTSASGSSTTLAPNATVESGPSDIPVTPNTPKDSSTNSSSSTGIKVGVGVGVAAIAVLGMAAATFFLLRRRKRQASTKIKAHRETGDETFAAMDQKTGQVAEHATAASELDGDALAEMWSSPVEQSGHVSELPGDQEFPQMINGNLANVTLRPVSGLEGDGARNVGSNRYT